MCVYRYQLLCGDPGDLSPAHHWPFPGLYSVLAALPSHVHPCVPTAAAAAPIQGAHQVYLLPGKLEQCKTAHMTNTLWYYATSLKRVKVSSHCVESVSQLILTGSTLFSYRKFGTTNHNFFFLPMPRLLHHARLNALVKLFSLILWNQISHELQYHDAKALVRSTENLCTSSRWVYNNQLKCFYNFNRTKTH